MHIIIPTCSKFYFPICTSHPTSLKHIITCMLILTPPWYSHQQYKKNFKWKFIKPFSYYNLSSRCFQILFSQYIRKWFEPRSNIPCLDMIIWVIGVLRMTAVGDWHSTTCAKLGHLQSQVTLKMTSAQVVKTSVTNSRRLQSPRWLFSIKVLPI